MPLAAPPPRLVSRARPAPVAPAAEVETLRACPLCGGGSHAKLATPGRWIGAVLFAPVKERLGLVRCRGCGLVFTNPRPGGALLSAFYAGDTYECHETRQSAALSSKAGHVLERVGPLLPYEAPRELLDYGAGGGAFLLDARRRGWGVRGFEPGRRGLESCRAAGLEATGDVGDLPEGAFGLITMLHVLEHIPEPGPVLYGLRRLVAPGGRLFVEVPNERSLRARLSGLVRGADERYRAFPIHLMYYNAGTLRGMLERCGWTVEAAFTMGLGMDELFERDGASADGPSRARARGRASAWRRMARDAFLGLGLGENLGVVARPRGAA